MIKTFLGGFKSGFTNFGKDVNLILVFLVLTFTYVAIVGPISLITRLFGKKYLELKQRREEKTYWKDYDEDFSRPDNYYKQY
ncbi:MAG: hypothetical protein ACE5DX_04000 [Candidatus Dojkabacteria bacterium]